MRKRPNVPVAQGIKPLEFMGTSREDLRAMPKEISRAFGVALFDAQRGGKPASAKPLKGYRGAGILELVEDNASDTYRAVYTVRFARAVCVLHAFQKNSTRGIKTPARDLALIEQRLRAAELDYAADYGDDQERA